MIDRAFAELADAMIDTMRSVREMEKSVRTAAAPNPWLIDVAAQRRPRHHRK
ncbi:hypothetical protein [Rhodococcoides fascians]|uniref:hypothetical protein n=1 Tax=Rhodococcoides fascians TaxID=1828 RepID=UPI000AE01CCA|nr:hypothetical protein [Rhodococcus fascians]